MDAIRDIVKLKILEDQVGAKCSDIRRSWKHTALKAIQSFLVNQSPKNFSGQFEEAGDKSTEASTQDSGEVEEILQWL